MSAALAKGSRRPWLANLALALAAVLTCLLGIEVWLRIAEQHPPVMLKCNNPPVFLDCYPSDPRHYFDVDLRDAATRARYETLFGRSLATEARQTPFAVEVRFNSQHFRDHEFPPRQPGVHRVMVLGDSFTEGQGVRVDDTYPRVLEHLLQTADPGRWEVLNAGHRGADFPQLSEMFEKQVLPNDPDVVIYGMVLNDVAQTPEFGARYPVLNDWIVGGHELPGFWQPRLLGFVSGRLEAKQIGEQSIRWYRDMYDEPNRTGWASTQRQIKRMAAQMRERGGTFAIALWPLLVDLDTDYPFADVHRKIAEFCTSAGIAQLDLLQTLRSRRTSDLWVHPADRHPNEIAHHLAAETLARAVRDPVPR